MTQEREYRRPGEELKRRETTTTYLKGGEIS